MTASSPLNDLNYFRCARAAYKARCSRRSRLGCASCSAPGPCESDPALLSRVPGHDHLAVGGLLNTRTDCDGRHRELDRDPPSGDAASVSMVRDVSAPRAPRGLDAYLSMCPQIVADAELREAPMLFDDLCEGGALSAAMAVSRYGWASESLGGEAAVLARALDLLPRARCPPAWSALVCNLSALFLEDIYPRFHRVRLRAAGRDTPFSLVPLRGRFGWRRRARWAGLDDAAGDSVND